MGRLRKRILEEIAQGFGEDAPFDENEMDLEGNGWWDDDPAVKAALAKAVR